MTTDNQPDTTTSEPAEPVQGIPAADAPDTTADTLEAPDAAATAVAPAEGDEQPAPKSGNSEAAKYRRQLRDAEAERDDVRGRLDRMQRALITRELDGAAVNLEGILAAGHSTADLLDADGVPDAEKLNDAITTTLEKFGLKHAPSWQPQYAPQGGIRPGTGHGSSNPWGDALNRRKR